MDRSDSRRRPLFMAAILAMLAVAGATTPGAAAGPALKADYRFEVSYASSVAGAPHLDSTPTGTSNVFQSVNMGNRKVPVMLFPADTGVDLPGMDNVIPRDSYTIVVLMRFDDISGYRRIIDFANRQSDDGLYSDNGDLAMYDQAEAANPTIAAGHWAQVVLTRSSAGRLKGFVDGVRQFSFDDSSTRLGVVTADNFLGFFRDDGTEDTSGAVARIRLYDGPLSESKVAALSLIPPPSGLSTSRSVTARGSSLRVKGSNFGPHEFVDISLTDSKGNVHLLGVAKTSASGAFSMSVTIPGGTRRGIGTIQAVGNPSGLSKTRHLTIS